MTSVEISYNYGMSPDEAVMRGIDNIREVYGIRRLDSTNSRVAWRWNTMRPGWTRRPLRACCAAPDWM